MQSVDHSFSSPISTANALTDTAYRRQLVNLLSSDLDFHQKDSLYAAHGFHSFPAKFPPQLPETFIQNLTQPGEVVLDPMMGSGTTILEAYFHQRQAIGLDIDPLALMIAQSKVIPFDEEILARAAEQVVAQARQRLDRQRLELEHEFLQRWDAESREFIEYWFHHETALELLALIGAIEQIPEQNIRLFLKVAFSGIIITKSGGVSLALDLAHTRPRRAKIVLDANEKEILREVGEKPPKHLDILTKTLRSPLVEFEKRCKNNLKGISAASAGRLVPQLTWGNAQAMPLPPASVDLIITSPPYASNAIDYMRAHKFSLIWFGYPLEALSQKRQEYIGGEALAGIYLEHLPPAVEEIVQQIGRLDQKKGLAARRYYSEMRRVLGEMQRVLKPGKAAIVVVGSSILRGIDTETHNCLAAIGRDLGFETPKIGVRQMDRNRRMMPVGNTLNLDSQIQQRMHEEYVIGFYKA